MEELKYVIFVYGTLKRFERANHLLQSSLFIGEAVTKPKYQLYSCGSFPALVSGHNKVFGELYGISDYTKMQLDCYEGVHDNYYFLDKIELEKITLHSFDNYNILEKPIHAYIYIESLDGFKKIDRWPCIENKITYNFQ